MTWGYHRSSLWPVQLYNTGLADERYISSYHREGRINTEKYIMHNKYFWCKMNTQKCFTSAACWHEKDGQMKTWVSVDTVVTCRPQLSSKLTLLLLHRAWELIWKTSIQIWPVNKVWKFKQKPHGLKIHLNKLILKGYSHSIIIKSLNIAFIGTNIDFLVNSLIRN